MSLYKRPDSGVYWYEFLFGGRRYRGSTKHTNLRAAERVENTLKTKLANSRFGIVERKPVPLLRDFARAFLERVKPEIRGNTLRGYRVSLGLSKDGKEERYGGLLSWFGSKQLDEIVADEIERFKQARMERELSPCTVNRDLACLRRILLFAVKLDVIPTTPFVAH